MSSIFISYCRSDRDAIDCILSELDKAGLTYWLDESDILPTMEFNEEILAGLTSCQWFLIVMTPQSAESEYVKDELHWALQNRNGRIIPILLAQCDPAAFHLRLLRIQYVDFTLGSDDKIPQLQQTLNRVQATGAGELLPLNSRSMDENLELISLLLTFIPRYHQKHLRNLLADADPRSYVGGRSVRHELRDLCTWALLTRRPGVQIGDQASDGRRFELCNVVQLTELGKRIAPHVS